MTLTQRRVRAADPSQPGDKGSQPYTSRQRETALTDSDRARYQVHL